MAGDSLGAVRQLRAVHAARGSFVATLWQKSAARDLTFRPPSLARADLLSWFHLAAAKRRRRIRIHLSRKAMAE
jgi:hypothetical protein